MGPGKSRARLALVVAVWFCLQSPALLLAAHSDCANGGCHQGLAPRQQPVATAEDASKATWGKGRTHAHGPFADQKCEACHLGHSQGKRPASIVRGSFPPSLYVRYSRSSYSACFDACHSAALVEEVRTTVATGFRNGGDNLHYRHVAKLERGRSCRLCHEPHTAGNKALIRDYLPFGVQRLTLRYEASDSGGKCTTSCHIPVSYSRDEAIPSPMRVAEPRASKELP